MEFHNGGLNPKITSCNEVFRFYYQGNEMEMCNFFDCVQDLCGEALFPKCSFYEMQGNVLNGYETVFILQAGFKADLTSLMYMGMEYSRIPTFLGKKQTSEKEIEIIGVESKSSIITLFSKNGSGTER